MIILADHLNSNLPELASFVKADIVCDQGLCKAERGFVVCSQTNRQAREERDFLAHFAVQIPG
jgi:hypothetical protein